ncbi:MAG: transcriptional regulator [Candidatus Eisenbacteria bacterium]|nr:transcriptional regulator [Candidatus Eisenbacteria bacterium]
MEFDPLLTPQRLAVLGALVPVESLSFSHLKAASGLQDGNLHVHAARLAEVGYLSIMKSTCGRREVTVFRITDRGLDAIRLHALQLQTLLAARRGLAAARPRRSDDAQVWS